MSHDQIQQMDRATRRGRTVIAKTPATLGITDVNRQAYSIQDSYILEATHRRMLTKTVFGVHSLRIQFFL
jgi:hypothetical protein